jgi:asparagine synthase (glutamine-hydrolysing)
MCGIGGVVGDAGGLDLAALARGLRHRGPDRQAELQPSPGIWLAAARLAIRDPSPAADQPFSSDDGALTVVFNGEIYNAAELRRTLEADGQTLRTRGDTELLLGAYRLFGDALVDRLEGMFAFALWDRTRRRLLLGRDPLGVKPLWWTRDRRRFVFASEVRALLAGGAVEARLAPAALRAFVATGSVAEAQAIVRGVEALAPGHVMVIDGDGGEPATRRYFTLPVADPEATLPSDAPALLREELDGAVERCMASDVPLGLLMSSGIDSNALAVLARGKALRSFHVRLGAASASRAARGAHESGFEHHEVVLAPDEVRDSLPALLAAQDQPSVDGANIFFIARALRAAGIKAALTGVGGDELFLGYPLHRSYLRVRAWSTALGPLARPLALGARVGGALVGRRLDWRAAKLLGVASALDRPQALYGAVRALFPSPWARALLPDAAPERLASDGELDIRRLELRHYLVDTLLRDADVMSMAQGVELRVPFLERRVVERLAAWPLPVARGPELKPLLFAAIPELSRDLARAPKEGFELPIEDWLQGAWRAPVEDVLSSAALAERAGLQPAAVAAVWRAFLVRRSRPAAFRAWALFNLMSWVAAHRASA